LGLTAGVVLLHALLLQSLRLPGWDEPSPLPLALRVRSVRLAPVPPADALVSPAAARLARPVPVPPQPRPGPAAQVAIAETPVPAAVPLPPSAPPPKADVPAVEDAAAPSGDIEVPVYPTQLPPPFELRFALQRPRQAGEAVLSWQREGERYQLRLSGSLEGAPGFESTSSGTIDTAGIAPLRFVDRRHGRAQAANFQREAGKISFSGPSTEYPLLPGSQDRVSWMVQLAGILAADPSLAQPGRQVTLFVAGARGGAEVWVFGVQGMDATEGVPSLKLLREPKRPYDTRAEVWLDPAQRYLPVHVRLANGDYTTDLLLRSTGVPAPP
jgi:hypothetical protein